MSNAFTDAVGAARKAAEYGFEFASYKEEACKLDEEVDEFRAALYSYYAGQVETPAAMAEELGDCLFVLVNIARYEGLEPEACLQAATRKFTRRVRAVADLARAQGADPDNLPLAQWKELWAQVKAQEGEG